MTQQLTVAAVQMVSTTDVQQNLIHMQKQVRQAAEQGADWVLLPEYWPIMGQNDSDKWQIAEIAGQGKLQTAMSHIAQECKIILFGGSIPIKSPQSNKVFNRLLVYGKNGEPLYHYDKMHLFSFQRGNEYYAESDSIVSGSHIPHFSHDGWNIAQGICYDLRFPEFFRAQSPFDILMLPAAFTHTTGLAHWHLLLKARAIENQSYVIAAAQGGKHQNGRCTFGHSIIIDPWGEIVAEHATGEGIICHTITREKLNQIRHQLPALQHRVLFYHDN